MRCRFFTASRQRLAASESTDFSPVRGALGRLRETLRDVCNCQRTFLLLVAFLLSNDGFGAIGRMAAVYGTELGIGQGVVIGAILMVQFIGIHFAFLFGRLASCPATIRMAAKIIDVDQASRYRCQA